MNLGFFTEGYDDLKQQKFSKIAERKEKNYYYKSDELLPYNKILSNYYNTIAEFYEFLKQEYYSTKNNIKFFDSLEEKILLYSYGVLNELELTFYHTIRQENIFALERLETTKIFYTTLYSIKKIVEKTKKYNRQKKYSNFLNIIDSILLYSYINYNILELQLLYNLKNSSLKSERQLHTQLLQFKKNYFFDLKKPKYDVLSSISLTLILKEAKSNIILEEEQKKYERKKTKDKKQKPDEQKLKIKKIFIEVIEEN